MHSEHVAVRRVEAEVREQRAKPSDDQRHAERDGAVARRSGALIRGVSGATMIMIGAIGRNRSAAPSGQ